MLSFPLTFIILANGTNAKKKREKLTKDNELNTGSMLVKLAISYWTRENVLMQNEMTRIIDT